MYVRQAVVLVGGKGTRLGELTRAVPKPLLEIGPGLRFLDSLLLELARHGFSDIVLLAGHLGDQVEAAYAGRNILDARVTVLREPEPQGTGGALRFAADILDPWFLMTNGDSLFEFNLRELTQGLDKSALGRLALREIADPARYGAVRLEGSRVTGFEEKNAALRGPALINGGVYALQRAIVDRIPGPCSIEQDVFPQLAREGRLEGQAFSGYFLDIGLPHTYDQARSELPARRVRPCAFLDRDGVLNVDKGYTHRPEDLKWTPGAQSAVRLLNDSGWYVAVVTNQAGVARGYYDEAAVHRFHQRMQEELAESGAHIDLFQYCPFHPDAVIERFRATDHPDRKPNPGMLLRTMELLPIAKHRSFLIGDQPSDLAAASAAGVEGIVYPGGDLLDLVQQRLSRDTPSR
jgi:D,D-heptose 1,7-bisphosphate phosphatase